MPDQPGGTVIGMPAFTGRPRHVARLPQGDLSSSL